MGIKAKTNKILNNIVNKHRGIDVSTAQELNNQNEIVFKDGISNDTISERIRALSKELCDDAFILLKNANNVLPLNDKKVSVFGRCQIDSFYSGYGSGGDVISKDKINIIDSFDYANINFDKELKERYMKFSLDPKEEIDKGYWAHWPSFYKELEIDDEDIVKYSKKSDIAIYVIGRGFGEDFDVKLEEGSYYLTKTEEKMIEKLSEAFKDLIVILNLGAIIDLSWTKKYRLSGLALAYYPGEVGFLSLADIIKGNTSPSGRLTFSIAKDYQDYPTSSNYGNKEYNNYSEDIFVGYRYFESFEDKKCMYPFGYGLSYTKFDIECIDALYNDGKVKVEVKVKNIGKCIGKDTILSFVKSPVKNLSKASKVLVGFGKTKTLNPFEEEKVFIEFSEYDFASYDEMSTSYILEEGKYEVFIGEDVRSSKSVFCFEIKEDKVISKRKEVLRPKYGFDKVSNSTDNMLNLVSKDLKGEIDKDIESLDNSYIDANYTLLDVLDNKISFDEFVKTLSLKELIDLSHGEGGMNSKLGFSGNAGVYGGITKELRDKGIDAIVTADGPSGVRINKQVNLIPCGLLLASSFNLDLVKALYASISKQMKNSGIDVLLAPGMNIIRNVLCGRNFEYFSEDPFLTGKLATSVVLGIQSHALSACPKHFACNNQEYNRTYNDSRLSERALREIYLKPFEMVVRDASPRNIMTSYNKINGVWAHYNYELVKEILIDEWGYKGVVITDWWMRKDRSKEYPKLINNAYRIRSCVNVLMPGNLTYANKRYTFDKQLYNICMKDDGIKRGELERNAYRVLKICLDKKKL